jgi:hypothetical protein
MDDCGANSYLMHKICGKMKENNEKSKNCCCHPFDDSFRIF